MDIGKYIGRFLLKNKYCSLSGLGVFDLKKNPSVVSGASGTVAPPNYTITFTPVGSIDDTFASFIATAENVSINNVSNHIKDYCKAIKDELARVGSFEIEHLGTLSMSGNKMIFTQSNSLDLGQEPVPIPVIEIRTQTAAEKTESKSEVTFSSPRPIGRKRGIKPMLIIVPLIAILLLSIIGYFGYQYISKPSVEESIPMDTPPLQVDTIATPQDTAAIQQDTLSMIKDTVVARFDTAESQSATNAIRYKVAVLSFDNQAMAESKANKLKGFGNITSVVSRSGQFIVAIDGSHPLNDTAKLVDSLRKMYNPKGPVYIMK
ncbi:MAG: hypothetical protein JNJ58_07105 [Chitinophagaceae bacterium]|nr:hypothetical protein [Chitinophagaceae bacterium]